MPKARCMAYFLCAAKLFAAAQMNVSVCNQGHFPEKVIKEAEAEAGQVFQSMGVVVAWAKCGREVGTEEVSQGHRFIVRLRSVRAMGSNGPASLETMGRAFTPARGDGYMADVYYPAVRAFAEQNGTGTDGLLGHVMAHELGHLLLGPGHSHQGIMQKRWSGAEAVEARHGRLNFGAEEQVRIREDLRERGEE